MIEVRHYGNRGPLVVLLHGGPGAAGSMSGLARLLSDSFRVLEPLQRRAGDLPLSVAQHVADLNAVLEHTTEPVHLVGFSWGAMLALSYAARHGDGLRQVVLIGCGTYDLPSRDVYRRQMALRTSPESAAELNRIDAELARETNQDRRDILFGRLGQIATRLQSHALMENDVESPAADERGYHETWADAIRLQSEGIQPAEFKNIAVPVLMLHGDQDPHPGSMIRDSLLPFIPQLRYVEFERCGHIPWLEREAQAEFIQVLRGALGQA